jgi:uncharacterized protein (TIGR02217 family)
MADFHEVQFPTTISRGSSGGPRRRTDIVTLRSGYEERNSVWADSRREYDAGLGIRDINDLHDVLAFFEARLGRLYGFRWKDWADYKSGVPNSDVSALDQTLTLVNGETTVYQLTKTYTSGPAQYTRKIVKPVIGTVMLAEDGFLLVEGRDFYVDNETGLVYIGYIPSGVITAGFEFDVPVRFAQDHIDITVDLFNAGSAPQIDILEIKTGLGVISIETQTQITLDWLSNMGVDLSTIVTYDNSVVWYNNRAIITEG